MGNMSLTHGQRLIGQFNPADNDQVTKLKKLAAEMIDVILETELESKIQSSLQQEAINKVIDAQMWAVKQIFTK